MRSVEGVPVLVAEVAVVVAGVAVPATVAVCATDSLL